MNIGDCQRIIANCDKLLPAINWPIIFQKLLERRVYYADDDDVHRWQADLNNIKTQREIYLKIQTRGPEAFQNFIKCLEDVGREDLADVLKHENNNEEVYNGDNRTAGPENNIPVTVNEIVEDKPTFKDDYYKRLRTTTQPLTVRVVKSNKSITQPDDKVMNYAMTSIPRGLVLLINNFEFWTEEMRRRGSEHDFRNLKDLFTQMGFQVVPRKNLTAEDMLETIKTFSQRPDLHNVSSIFVVIMSHGSEVVSGSRSETVISGIDEKYVMEREILNHFTGRACENMCKKPKVFIFQTCRGKHVQKAIGVSNVFTSRLAADVSIFAEQTFMSTPVACRDYSDMLVAHSTLPGQKSYRDKDTGSWYIQILCEVMMNHAHDTEISTMLQMADERLAGMHNANDPTCQTSGFTNYGFKRLYLNPAIETTTES